jgi:multiple sugar transport system ATP-binding protein
MMDWSGAPGEGVPEQAISRPSLPDLKSGREVTIGIRPEHVRIENAGLKANVHVVEPTGSETQVVIDLGGTLLTCVFRERVAAKPGEEINIGFDRQALHLFHSTSGQRLN